MRNTTLSSLLILAVIAAAGCSATEILDDGEDLDEQTAVETDSEEEANGESDDTDNEGETEEEETVESVDEEVGDSHAGGGASESEEGPDLPSCEERMALFSVEPLDPADYLSIIPLGNLQAPAHTFPTVHTYLELTDRNQAAPLYSPGDLTITQIRSMTVEATGKTDYVIDFYACDEVSGYFDHVTTLTEEILGEVGTFTNCSRYNPGDGDYLNCTAEVLFEVTAGQLLGYAGGPTTTGSAALDFGLRDERSDPLYYLNEERLINPDQLYVVCPYDYFETGEVRENLFDKLALERSVAPLCGAVEVDVEGTAQGRWYLAGSEWGTSEADHVALVPSNHDPDVQVLSIGNSDVGTGTYHFDKQSAGRINRDFADVTNDGQVYCYDTLRNRADLFNSQPIAGYLFLQMTDGETLKLERVTSGSCPADPQGLAFSSAAVLFER